MKSKLFAALLASAAAALLSSSAQAALTVTAVPGPTDYSLFSPGIINFDLGTLDAPSGVTWSPITPTSLVKVLNSTSNQGAEPNGDSSPYLSVLAGGEATLSKTTGGILSLTMFVGSLDTYNTFIFHPMNGDAAVDVTGASMLGMIPGAISGCRTCLATNRWWTFNFSEGVNKIDFESSINSLEIDDIGNFKVTTQGFIPEPGTWVVMLAGFGLLGMALRRKLGGFAFAS